MQSQPIEPTRFVSHSATEHPLAHPTYPSGASPLSAPLATDDMALFHSQFTDHMVMGANVQTVAAYLSAHQTWFHQCAQPMQVEEIGTNSYALTIGHFGAFGYDIEPKIGLDLLPATDRVYRIVTVPVPDQNNPGYDIDFQAGLELVDASLPERPLSTTQVQWQLDLTVAIKFPRFIRSLPGTLIQRTGERLLQRVVRQISQRLTYKVQENFHTAHGLTIPRPH